MNTNWDISIRFFKCEIFSGRNIKRDIYISKLDIENMISFDTSESVIGGCNELNLNITGLSISKFEELSTSCSAFNVPIINNRIDLYAGYDNN